MNQIDFIHLKSKTESVDFSKLTPHPTIKNRYHLKRKALDDWQLNLFEKNLDIWTHNENVDLKTSLPYLFCGHNYVMFTQQNIFTALDILSDFLNIDLFHSSVEELEYAFITESLDFEHLTGSILTAVGYQTILQKKNLLVLRGIDDAIKFYDPCVNLKKKLSKKQYDRIEFNHGRLKTEIKYLNPKKSLKRDLVAGDLCSNLFMNYLNKDFMNRLGSILLHSAHNFPKKPSIIQLTYGNLLKLCDQHGLDPAQILTDSINGSDLSHSQKSQRRKAVKRLVQTYGKSYCQQISLDKVLTYSNY
ncbi:hypothetical protein [Flagellimonas meridianipacifica]|uniref:Uncharacterized protein n=1 Tax=Flagellimonas meridianipacifica TaxID=1080225 RepID=A0A2T0MFM0_9FLAO|nr:hypothetical protein [Allomuricauda pacifica]PRX56369.1 hypothetical protein CLV81_0366 [Allomuricauda pacifica]